MIRHRFYQTDFSHRFKAIVVRFSSSVPDAKQSQNATTTTNGRSGVSDLVPLHLLDETTKLRLANRHTGIVCHPDSISQNILPYDQILKTNPKTGSIRLMDVDRSYGYFWTLTDLKKTQNKPIITSSTLIPIEHAKIFPSLGKVSGKIKPIISTHNTHTPISLPTYFTRFNRSKDPAIECTLVTVTFNDYGYQMIPSWIHPFRQAFHNQGDDSMNRTKIYQLIIHEGRILQFFESMITRSFQKQTSLENQSSILLYFTRGDSIEDEEYHSFRDALRMHNNKTAYVFLLDGIGRVRFAASGQPQNVDEIQLLIEHTKNLVPSLR